MFSYGIRHASVDSGAKSRHHHPHQHRLNGDIVFKICIMCLVNVHDLQACSCFFVFTLHENDQVTRNPYSHLKPNNKTKLLESGSPFRTSHEYKMQTGYNQKCLLT